MLNNVLAQFNIIDGSLRWSLCFVFLCIASLQLYLYNIFLKAMGSYILINFYSFCPYKLLKKLVNYKFVQLGPKLDKRKVFHCLCNKTTIACVNKKAIKGIS